jgi:hypothetical protein
MPTVAVGDEPLKFRQLCLVYSTEFPFSVEEAHVSHEVNVEGDVRGLEEKFLKNSFVFKRPQRLADEDVWQVITYISSEGVEIAGDAIISAKIRVGDAEFNSDLRFFRDSEQQS